MTTLDLLKRFNISENTSNTFSKHEIIPFDSDIKELINFTHILYYPNIVPYSVKMWYNHDKVNIDDLFHFYKSYLLMADDGLGSMTNDNNNLDFYAKINYTAGILNINNLLLQRKKKGFFDTPPKIQTLGIEYMYRI